MHVEGLHPQFRERVRGFLQDPDQAGVGFEVGRGAQLLDGLGRGSDVRPDRLDDLIDLAEVRIQIPVQGDQVHGLGARLQHALRKRMALLDGHLGKVLDQKGRQGRALLVEGHESISPLWVLALEFGQAVESGNAAIGPLERRFQDALLIVGRDPSGHAQSVEGFDIGRRLVDGFAGNDGRLLFLPLLEPCLLRRFRWPLNGQRRAKLGRLSAGHGASGTGREMRCNAAGRARRRTVTPRCHAGHVPGRP